MLSSVSFSPQQAVKLHMSQPELDLQTVSVSADPGRALTLPTLVLVTSWTPVLIVFDPAQKIECGSKSAAPVSLSKSKQKKCPKKQRKLCTGLCADHFLERFLVS